MTNAISISIVIPVFNSQRSLRELNERLHKSLGSMNQSYELIFVDDASRDDSWITLKEINSSNKNVQIVRLTKNFGQHNATLCGISLASGETIITMDDDLEHSPEAIPELYQQFKQEGRDVFYACPIKRNKNLVRNTSSSIWGKAAKATKKGSGKASSFRFMKNEIGQCLLNHKEPFVYIESILYWYTDNIGHRDIVFEKRKYGQSNYSFMQLFRLNHDLGMHYDTHILKFMKNGGTIVCLVSFLLIAYYLIKKFSGNAVPGYTSVIVTVLFATGSLLWGMGYLGLYIGKMFRIMNKEPQFHVAEKFKSQE